MKPCKFCPYRKNSLKGYLGESLHNPKEFLQQLELLTGHPCHSTVKDWNQDTHDKPRCIGSLQFMNNSCKRHKNTEIVYQQSQVGKNEEVFSFEHNFIKHHENLRN